MELLSGILISSYQGLMLFIIAKIILNIKYSTKEKVSISIITIISGLLFILLDKYSLFLIIVIDTLYLYRKVKIYSILAMVGSVLILYLGNLSAISSFILLDTDKFNNLIVKFFYIVLFTVTALVLSILVRYIITKLRKSYLHSNKLYIVLVSLFLAVTFITLYVFMPSNIDNSQTLQLMIIVYTAFILAIIILVIVISYTVLREMRYKRQMQEIENYYKYTLRIEKINNDMRKFRHDYVNILLSMSEFIRDDDMDGLKKYFDDNIVPLKDTMQTNSFKINGIERLHIRELKGLLTTKIIQAQENNIRVSIEVPDEIDHISMNMIDLSRIMGIILDNAIEASKEIEDPLIQIGFMKNNDTIVIIVMNKCAKDIPKVHELFKENFSTKGNNRGLGLSTLKEIVENTDNVLLDTIIENHYFIQKLEIMTTDHEDVN